jgi:hypothetical protein
MYEVQSQESPPIAWWRILVVTMALLLATVGCWPSEYSSTVPERLMQTIAIGTIVGTIVELSLVASVLIGRWRGWPNRWIQRLLGLAALIVAALITWTQVVPWVVLAH